MQLEETAEQADLQSREQRVMVELHDISAARKRVEDTRQRVALQQQELTAKLFLLADPSIAAASQQARTTFQVRSTEGYSIVCLYPKAEI